MDPDRSMFLLGSLKNPSGFKFVLMGLIDLLVTKCALMGQVGFVHI
jgi:hypothetical protein